MIVILVIGVSATIAARGLLAFAEARRGTAASQRVDREVQAITLFHEVHAAAMTEGIAVGEYYLFHNPTYAQTFRQSRVEADATLTLLRDAAAARHPDEASGIDELRAAHDAIAQQGEQIVQALERNDTQTATALMAGPEGLESKIPPLVANVEKVSASAEDDVRAAQQARRSEQTASLWIALGITAFWGLLVFGIAAATFRWLVAPLERASRASRALAAGDLTARLDQTGPRELARLGADVNDMAESLIRRSDELNAYLARNLEARTEELQASEQRFRALVEHATDLITVIEADGTIIYQSPSIERVLGYTPADVIGCEFTGFVHPEDLHSVATFVTDAMKSHDAVTSTTVRVRALDGTWRYMTIVGTDHRDDNAVRGLVLNIRDISERHALEEQLRFDAFHDPLTRLANRVRFMDRLEHALARRARRSSEVAVLFLDLDNFKSVNDGLGHAAGDELLVEVARRLAASTRPEDTVARLGGDEFAVLLEELVGSEGAAAAAQRVLAELRAPVRIGAREVFARASIGIATSIGETDGGVILRNADVAMYAAKSLGKGRYEIYHRGMRAAALDRLSLIADLEGAVERREFIVEYQPILTLASGEVAGVEALVRWNHPTLGLIQPETFISLAEETGTIIDIGRWVLDEACRQACDWQRELGADPPLAMNVNVSARQLLQPGFVEDVARALADWQISPASLVLEITESVMMHDVQVSLAILREIKGLGVRLAIDDFGTGYSSLSYVRQFPFDILKIDRSLLATGAQAADVDLERAIVDMGRTLDLEIVAEGIEQADQLARLKSLHCERGQGFYFAPPMSADAIRVVLRERRGERHAA